MAIRIVKTFALTALFLGLLAPAANAQTAAEPSTEPAATAAAAPTASPDAAAVTVTQEEIRKITEEVARAAAACTEKETVRRCADYHAKEVKLQCWPNDAATRRWLATVGRDQRLEDEGNPTRIVQNQVAELRRQKAGGGAVRLSDFPECRDPR